MPGKNLILADSHFENIDGVRVFEGFMDSFIQKGDRLYILGDMFCLWIGLRKAQKSYHGLFVGCMKSAMRKGIEVHYVEGNRDFFIKNSFLESSFSSVSDSTAILKTGQEKYLLVHGDKLNRNDRQYILWNALSKSRFVKFTAGLLPAILLNSLSDRMEQKLRSTNIRNKSVFPEKDILEKARKLKSQGFSGLITGHFHEEKSLSIEDFNIYSLPAWKDTSSYLEITDSNPPILKQYKG